MKIVLSDDARLVNEVKAKLIESGGYCPCSLIQNEDTRCMCKEFREMSEGTCHCGMYKKIKETT